MSSYLIHGGELEDFKYPEGCPFNTSRAARACGILDSMDLLAGEGKQVVVPVCATRDEL